MSTSAVEDTHHNQMLHSHAEDNYVMASTISTVLERQSSGDAKEDPKTGTKERPRADTEETPKADAKSTPAKSAKGPEPPRSDDPAYDEVPETPTSFKMTEEFFRRAKNAKAGSMGAYWAHTMYRGPKDNAGKPKKTMVHYCKSVHTTERVLQNYFMDEKVIGFDIEWKENAHRNSDAKSNVSLIQIASETRIALFHVALYPKAELVAPTFKKIMEDVNVTKVGVSIKGDCTRIRKWLGIDTKGIFELSHLYKLVKFSESKDYKSINRKLVSLATQTQEHLHLPMFKGDVRCSDWSKSLSNEQVLYAASDSYAGFQIYHTLEMKRKALDPTPPRPYHAELNLPICIAEDLEISSEGEEEETEVVDTKSAPEIEPQHIEPSAAELAAAAEYVSMEDPELASELASLESEPLPADVRDEKQVFSSHTSQLVHDAEVLASCYLDSTHNRSHRRPNPRAQASPLFSSQTRGRNLRTYFLWSENPDLSLNEIGALLRSPPLNVRTVAIMILEAVRVERMPFDKARLRTVLSAWRAWGAKYVVNVRYKGLEEECDFVIGEGENSTDSA